MPTHATSATSKDVPVREAIESLNATVQKANKISSRQNVIMIWLAIVIVLLTAALVIQVFDIIPICN